MNKKNILDIFYEKDDVETYRKFQEIENNIEEYTFLYDDLNEIKTMLENDKSYTRVRAFRIICKLASYDKDNKITADILKILDDSKPTVVRQCLKALNNLLLYKPELSDEIENKLKKFNYSKFKDSMAPLIKNDIDYILKHI